MAFGEHFLGSEKRCNFATSMRKEIGSAEEQPISAIFDAGHASVTPPCIGVFLCSYVHTLTWWLKMLQKPLLDRAMNTERKTDKKLP